MSKQWIAAFKIRKVSDLKYELWHYSRSDMRAGEIVMHEEDAKMFDEMEESGKWFDMYMDDNNNPSFREHKGIIIKPVMDEKTIAAFEMLHGLAND